MCSPPSGWGPRHGGPRWWYPLPNFDAAFDEICLCVHPTGRRKVRKIRTVEMPGVTVAARDPAQTDPGSIFFLSASANATGSPSVTASCGMTWADIALT